MIRDEIGIVANTGNAMSLQAPKRFVFFEGDIYVEQNC